MRVVALYAFNGTWNSRKTEDLATAEPEAARNTNVVRVLEAYDAPGAFYVNGVGTRAGLLGKIVGGAFGVGGRERLDEALAHLRRRRDAGDAVVDIVGFSRGAALALAFANRIARKVRDADRRSAPIRFLGLFDVVASFGIPYNLGPFKFQEYNVGYELTLPTNVEYCFHAMALDERRQSFRVTRVTGAYEVWFRGAHSDIGGGNGNLALNGIACAWMLRKAAACGLPVRQDAILAAAAACNAAAPVQWPLDFIDDTPRRVRPWDRVHHTVAVPSRIPRYNEPPAACPREDVLAELTAARTGSFA